MLYFPTTTMVYYAYAFTACLALLLLLGFIGSSLWHKLRKFLAERDIKWIEQSRKDGINVILGIASLPYPRGSGRKFYKLVLLGNKTYRLHSTGSRDRHIQEGHSFTPSEIRRFFEHLGQLMTSSIDPRTLQEVLSSSVADLYEQQLASRSPSLFLPKDTTTKWREWLSKQTSSPVEDDDEE